MSRDHDPVTARTAEDVAPEDVEAVRAQLGRLPRGLVGVAHRCACGRPDVVETAPRLPDGTPFPTLHYLTCPRATSAVSTLESRGVMRELEAELAADEGLRAAYAAAHDDYLRRRRALGDVPEIDGISAGGMPTRVKCLHVLVAHSLAAGPGVNPLGDRALAMLGPWAGPARPGSCVSCPGVDGPDAPSDGTAAGPAGTADGSTTPPDPGGAP